MIQSAEQIIRQYDLSAHPEGGFYREIYRSPLDVSFLKPGASTPVIRSASTFIYFLLRRGDRSHLHRIGSDELWHFYLGGPLKVSMISDEGRLTETILGTNPDRQQSLHLMVPAGVWFGAEPLEESDYSLVGCTVAPGFDFQDFELAKYAELSTTYPHLDGELKTLCLPE